jgi:glutathione S-transferase
MRLYSSSRAPNPRRVQMFIAEKAITGIETVEIDLVAHGHRSAEFAARNPFQRVPVLELDDGRHLSESRAICTWLEAMYPEPNLMGRDGVERAFIEEADRRAEFTLLLTVAMWIRHTHPGLAALEQPQFPDYGRAMGERLPKILAWYEERLGRQPWLAGERFSIADITAMVAIDFARVGGFKPAAAGFTHIAAWRERLQQRGTVPA